MLDLIFKWFSLSSHYWILLGNGTPLQYSCLENPMDGGDWQAPVHGVAQSRAQLSDFTLTFHFHALEKEMATHSSILAWRIPGTGEPSGLPSMGLHRVGHDWSNLAVAVAVLLLYLRVFILYSGNFHEYWKSRKGMCHWTIFCEIIHLWELKLDGLWC